MNISVITIFWQKVKKFFSNKRNLYYIGLVLVLIAAVIELSRGRHKNFLIFQYATLDFWNGINPYINWNYPLDVFVYGPLFNILFAPFAYPPTWAGALCWNAFNLSFYFLAVFSLPKQFANNQKRDIYLYTLLILVTTMLSFQTNAMVAYLFVFAYINLERDKGFWAVLLILISGFIKIYGIFQLALLLMYPKFWKNMGYALAISLVFLLIPLVKIPFDGLIDYYMLWFAILGKRHNPETFETIFNLLHLFSAKLLNYITFIQIGSFAILGIITLFNRKKFSQFVFRTQILGILMGWAMLFGMATEKQTYIIALLGYMLWYYVTAKHSRFDKILFWANFIILIIVPIDLFCPASIMKIIFGTLHLNLWLFLFTWLRMCWIAFSPKEQNFMHLVENTNSDRLQKIDGIPIKK